MSPTAGSRAAGAVCVVLHDVAPARWGGCLRVLSELRRCASQAGVALPVASHCRWCRACTVTPPCHRDEGPRRHYTAGEGEFAALSHAEAAARLAEGRAWTRAHGLPMNGFVPPAWLMDPDGLRAVAEAGFDHTCTLTEVTQAMPTTGPSCAAGRGC